MIDLKKQQTNKQQNNRSLYVTETHKQKEKDSPNLGLELNYPVLQFPIECRRAIPSHSDAIWSIYR